MTLKKCAPILALMHAAIAWAAPVDPLSEMDYFSEQPVVLSASRLSQPVNRAPAAVTVITREMIEASGFRHLVDVLRLVPGFVVGWSGGNMPAATYLGLSDAFPHRMQIMVDGRSIYNPAYGHTTWRAIPLTLDDVDHIEVVRGPNAAIDGINSLLGTIHIFTRHSATTQGGMGELAAGDKQFKEVNLRYGAETSRGSWRLALLGREDERHGVAQDHASDMQLSFRGDYQPTHQDDLLLQLGVSRGIWRGSNVGSFILDDPQAYFLSGVANLQWKRTKGEGREWSLRLHHTFNQNEEDIPLPAPLDPLNGNYRTSSSGIQFTYLNKAAASLHTSLSGEYRQDRAYAPSLLSNDKGVSDNILRLSGEAEWSISPEWVLHTGAMLERHSDTSSTYLSPRVALNWLPSREHAFRLGASHGESALGLYANNTDIKITINGLLFDQILHSTDKLKPEKINSSELGYLFNKPEWSLNLDVRAFHNRIYDLGELETITVPDDIWDGVANTHVSKRDITQHGLEYQLRWRPSQYSWLILSQSWVSVDGDQGTPYSRSTPQHTLSLLAALPIAGINVSLGYYRIGEMRWIAADSESKYNRLDLRLATNWKTSNSKVEAALTLQSLLGSEFESMTGDIYAQQRFGRRGYLSLKYEFR